MNPRVDPNGTVNLRLRIEEVSKNHQKQAFRIKISPDTSFSPANCDVSCVLSSAITVRSKRNKKRPRYHSSSVRSYPPGLDAFFTVLCLFLRASKRSWCCGRRGVADVMLVAGVCWRTGLGVGWCRCGAWMLMWCCCGVGVALVV